MLKSENFKQFTTALVKFQGSMELLKTNSIAKTEKYSFKYADLAAVWDIIRKPLADNNLAVIQDSSTKTEMATEYDKETKREVAREKARVTISTLIIHTSGEWVSSEMVIAADANTAQKIGSATSYGRRYQLLSMLGLASEDDDGNAASSLKEPVKSQPPTQKPPAPANPPAQPPANETPGQKRMREAKEAAAKAAEEAKNKAPAQPAQSAPASSNGKKELTPAEYRQKIDAMLLDIEEGNLNAAAAHLEGITQWTKKKDDGTEVVFAGKKTTTDISDKACPVIYGKVQKEHEQWLKNMGFEDPNKEKK